MSFDDTNNVTLLKFDGDSLPPETEVLVLEDSAVDRGAMERYAAKSDLNLAFHFVETLEALKSTLERKQFHLSILDYHVPDGTFRLYSEGRFIARDVAPNHRECASKVGPQCEGQ